MSVSSLAENFDDLIATPEDVEQLNRAILQLAMQGNLVKQDNTNWDETLVRETIAQEIEILIEKGKLTKPSNVLPVLKNEIPKDKPAKWICLRLGECMGLVNGRAYSQSELLDNGTPVIRIQNLNGGDRWYYSDLDLSPEKYCESGDLLFAWSASFGPYIWDGPRAIFHYHIWRLELTSIIDKNFAFYLLKYITERVKAASHGLAMLHITKTKMENWVIVLPPLVEQQRIVASMEELFAQTRALAKELDHSRSELDGLNKSALSHLLASEFPEEFNQNWAFISEHFDLLFQSPEHLTPLRQSILELAVRGKLTRRESGDESAKELLKRILTERRKYFDDKSSATKNGNKASYVDPAPPNTDDLPNLPNGWLWVRAEQVCGFITKGTTPSAEKLFSRSGDIPFLKVYNLTDRGDLDFSINPTFVSRETHEGELARSRVIPGDVLMNIVGPPLGKVSIVPDTYPEWNINQAIVIFRPFNGLIKEYLCLMLLENSIFGWANRQGKGTAGQSNLTLEICRNLPLPLPPVAEQERIVKRVEQLLSLCDALEARLQSAEEERGRLVAAVMAGVGS